ncbi:MAG: sporulation protein YabP [Ruminococcaceae bacterium]|nr:sporulation protein YabP [Oscillospiraceae bacterium]
MNEDRKNSVHECPQNINMENREALKISGVKDVKCFNENLAELDTVLGKLTVRGEGIKIARLSLDEGVLELTGYMYSCEYEDKSKLTRRGKFGGMFG